MESALALARRLLRSVSGPMWHGPALSELLDGVTAAQAAARVAPQTHSIWELTLHMAAWAEIATDRLHGERIAYPPDDEDWPAVADPATDDAWDLARERLFAAYESLSQAAHALGDSALDQAVAGQPVADRHSIRDMLEGVVEHGAYHGGQIALLRRAGTAQ